MGNLNMEATQIHYRHDSTMTVDKKLQNLEGRVTTLEDGEPAEVSKADIAPVFSAETAYSAGDYVYHEGHLYKFTADHAAGAWSDLDTETAVVTADLAEQAGDIDELKSGLTNVETELNGDATVYPYADVITINDAIPANLEDCSVKIDPMQNLHGYDKPWAGGAGKNKLPMTVEGIKELNTSGTWSGNNYTFRGVVWTILTDDANNVTGIAANQTATQNSFFDVGTISPDVANGKILNGCPASGSASTYFIQATNNSNKSVNETGSGIEITDFPAGNNIIIRMTVISGYSASNLIFYPMIRLSTESDATFAPYTNLCPISGHTEASVQRTGKNWFDPSVFADSVADFMTYKSYKVPNGTYTMSTPDFPVASNVTNIFFMSGIRTTATGGNSYDDGVWAGHSKTITITDGYYTVAYRSSISQNTNNPSNYKWQIERGETASEYEPYAGQTYTLALGDTIYGGTVDFDSGVMTVTMANIASYNGETIGEPWISSMDEYVSGATPTTGAQVVYTLATPTTIQLTPQQIQLLKGTNTIYASTGQISVTVNGVSDSIGAVQEQVNDMDVALAEKLPTAPTTDGAYVLTVTVASGTPTYSWERAT